MTSAATVKAALGIADATYDAQIGALITRVSDEIVAYLRLPAADDGRAPTLGREVYEETIRYVGGEYDLLLTRRPIASVASVNVDGFALVAGTDYQTSNAVGSLQRLDGDEITTWSGEKIVIAYTAGYILPGDAGTRNLPQEIEEAAIYAIAARMADLDPASIDPDVKSETLVGVYEATYATGGVSSRAYGDAGYLPYRARALLAAHRSPMI